LLTENKLIQKINEFSANQTKLYGKAIDHQLDNIMYFLDLSYKFRLKKLRNECINYLAKQFSEQIIEKNFYYIKIENDDKLEILRKKLCVLDEKVLSKDKKLKQLEDENLRQKFEIRRLKSSNDDDKS
jgi:hypothetical protein